MAPKRAAKKAAPAPPPPPPTESSDETRSGSRSRSDESEDEEAIAESPVPAATPAPKSTPAPAQQGDESESSDEEEEEEEDEEPARAAAATAPKKHAPPPQKKEDSDEEEEDDDEEEEEEEPTRAAPPSAPKKQPPQPPRQSEESDSSDKGESDEEAPPPKPAPKKEAAVAVKPPAPAAAAAADEAKKPAAFHRIWSTDDEVRILEALAAHQRQHGTFPQPEALIDVLAGKLDNPAYGSKELQSKVKSLKNRYVILSKRGEVPGKEHDRRVLDLSKIVWDGDKATAAVNNGEQKGFNEMCELYPYLAEEVKELEARLPGMCKREFGKMDDDKARAMDEKIKRQRVLQIRVEMRHADLIKEVIKALVDLVDG